MVAVCRADDNARDAIAKDPRKGTTRQQLSSLSLKKGKCQDETTKK